MNKEQWVSQIEPWGDRRSVAIPGGYKETIDFCTDHFITTANKAIAQKGFFSVALCGGSTPKALFESLALEKNWKEINWSRVLLFWSDERCVPPDHVDSNYRMAMEAGFLRLPIPDENIHRMQAEKDAEQGARDYENIIKEKRAHPFDLITLGMGSDGHTASLFPKTHGLHAMERLVIANYIPQMKCWRMTMTYECINAAKCIAIYVLGPEKAPTVKKVLQSISNLDADLYPIQKIGTPTNKALWILDNAAAAGLAIGR